jgi:hypothetical protein
VSLKSFFRKISLARGERIISPRNRRERARSGTNTARSRNSLPQPESEIYPPKKSSRPRQVISEVLDIDDFYSRVKEGIRIQSSINPRRFYLLKWKKQIEVYEYERLVGSLCIGPKQSSRYLGGVDYLSMELYLAFYLNLILNEKEFLGTANLMSRSRVNLLENLDWMDGGIASRNRS